MDAENARLYTPDEKVKRIKRELTRLRKSFKPLPEDKRRLAEGLMQEVAFMRVTLEETREIIDREGVIELFEQGKQRFLREHPATKVYASLVNRYSAVVKQLVDLLPDPKQGQDVTDELMEFVKKQAR